MAATISPLPGIYRHYKGRDYLLFKIATHSETRESLAVYRCLYGDFSWWVRPLSMFTETVEHNGEISARFAFVAPLTGQALFAGASDDVLALREWLQRNGWGTL